MAKGGRRSTSGQGRPKGSQNKVTKELKDMIHEALERAGGADYLFEQSQANPVAFMNLISKILPRDVSVGGTDGGPVRVVTRIELVGFEKKE